MNTQHVLTTPNVQIQNKPIIETMAAKKEKKKILSWSRYRAIFDCVLTSYFISSIFLFVRSFSLCLYPVLVHLFLFEHLLLANWPIVNNPKIHNKLAVQSKHQSKLSDAKKFTCWVFSKSLHNFLPPLLYLNTEFIHSLSISLKLYYNKWRAFHCPILLC